MSFIKEHSMFALNTALLLILLGFASLMQNNHGDGQVALRPQTPAQTQPTGSWSITAGTAATVNAPTAPAPQPRVSRPLEREGGEGGDE